MDKTEILGKEKDMVSGRNIKIYLDRHGIKQKFLSEKTGIPENTLSAMLNENRRIEVNEYIGICKALDVSLNTFAGVPEQEKEVG